MIPSLKSCVFDSYKLKRRSSWEKIVEDKGNGTSHTCKKREWDRNERNSSYTRIEILLLFFFFFFSFSRA